MAKEEETRHTYPRQLSAADQIWIVLRHVVSLAGSKTRLIVGRSPEPRFTEMSQRRLGKS